jgi:hypothetical protein
MNKFERESLALAIARVTARIPLPWQFLGSIPHSVFAARGESVAELDAEAPVEKLLVDCVNAVPKLIEALAAAEARIAELEAPPLAEQPQCSFRDAQGLQCQAGAGHEPASMHLFVTTSLSGEPPSCRSPSLDLFPAAAVAAHAPFAEPGDKATLSPP